MEKTFVVLLASLVLSTPVLAADFSPEDAACVGICQPQTILQPEAIPQKVKASSTRLKAPVAHRVPASAKTTQVASARTIQTASSKRN
jgi:hypothetical protein